MTLEQDAPREPADDRRSQAWERSGWHPTEYCLRYRKNRDELTTSMEEFVHGHAT